MKTAGRGKDSVMIRLFIGFDWREAGAYHVLSHSVIARASKPVSSDIFATSRISDSSSMQTMRFFMAFS